MPGHDRRAPGRSRRGSFFAIVLIVLFVLTVILFGLQYLSVDTIRQTRTLLEAAGAPGNADGVFHVFMSNCKSRLQPMGAELLLLPKSGTESGTWEARPFVLGWAWAPLKGQPSSCRISVWIRFPEETPLRTFRYDAVLRTPILFCSHPVQLTRIRLEPVDPSSEQEIQAAFDDGSTDPANPDALLGEATVEAYSSHIEGLVGQGRTLAEIESSTSPAAVGGTIPGFQALLTARLRALEAETPRTQVDEARKVLDLARSSGAWLDAARYMLASALSRDLLERTRSDQEARLKEAEGLLQEILAAPGGSCAAPRTAWLLAKIRMMRDHDLAKAKKVIEDITNDRPGDPAAHRTDVTRRELPACFETLWKPRVATSLKVGDRNVVASVLDDGTKAVIHAESVEGSVRPLAWAPAGGQILSVASGPNPQFWQTELDGTGNAKILTEGVNSPWGQCTWAHAARLRPSADAIVVDALLRGSTPLGASLDCVRNAVLQGSGSAVFPGGSIVTLTQGVISPDGKRFVGIMGSGLEHPGHQLFECPGMFEGNSTGGLQPIGNVEVPNDWHYNVTGLSWAKLADGKEWIGFVAMKTSEFTVHFFDPNAGKPDTRSVTVTVAAEREDVFEQQTSVSQAPPDRFVEAATIGTLVSRPAGYLFASKDRLHLVPLPGPSGMPPEKPAEWPANLKGSLAEIRDLTPSPAGGAVFFTARTGEGGPRALYRLDTGSGNASVLLGPGSGAGSFPGASDAQGAAVSPVFDTGGAN